MDIWVRKALRAISRGLRHTSSDTETQRVIFSRRHRSECDRCLNEGDCAQRRPRTTHEICYSVAGSETNNLRRQRRNRSLVGDLRRQMRTELRLAAGTLQKDYQPTCHRQCKIATVVVLDQLQREIDAGGYSGRGIEGTVLNIDLVRRDFGGWEPFGKFSGMLPMRRRIHSVEETCGTEKKCTGAHRAISPRLRSAASQPCAEIWVRIDESVVGRAG